MSAWQGNSPRPKLEPDNLAHHTVSGIYGARTGTPVQLYLLFGVTVLIVTRPPPAPSRLEARVLGVDPGSRYTGWAVVLSAAGRFQLAAGGVITTDPAAPMASRLCQILLGLRGVIAVHQPDVAAIEQIFSHRSPQSALVLGQARGVALAALAEGTLSVHEYNASTIKHSVGGSGKADKDQVARMVQMLLGEQLDGRSDMQDACAIAMTHHLHAGRVSALSTVPTRVLPKVRKLDPRSPGAWGVTVDAKGRAAPVVAGTKR